MREILFRGRCVGEDHIYEWVDGYYVRLKDPYKKRETHRIYTGYAESDCENFYGDWYEVNPKTLGQFTGLYDKNGERIYEGDIVKRVSIPMFVGWDEDSASFIVEYVMNGERYSNALFGHGELEVIGNIHDNPELMEGRA